MIRAAITKELIVLQSEKLRFVAGLTHGFSTRSGGVSRGPYESLNLSLSVQDEGRAVRENRNRWCQALQCQPTRLVIPQQTHGVNILEVDQPGIYADTDALISHCANLYLSIQTADCVPIILYDPGRRAIGLVHAGWRGIIGDISARTVVAMQQHFGTEPEQLLTILGPAICRNCYEVGQEIAHQFAKAEYIQKGSRYFVDLVQAVCHRLIKAGILPENIEILERCTACEPESFFSHRRDGFPTGRQMAVIALT
jgi:YfiH family protein